MKIAVQGCCHGELNKIYSKLQALMKRQNTRVDLLVICGDFQAMRDRHDLEWMACPIKYRHMGDFQDYFTGRSIAPVPTIFIGGNHEASNHLNELYYGGWVCPNIYYMGHSGVVNFGGLRIAGISGIYNPHHYQLGYYEREPMNSSMIRSAYHYREFEIKKLQTLKEHVDIFVSHEWPQGIYHHGNTEQLLKIKPYFKKEVENNELGAEPLKTLMESLQPKNWFAAHLHVGFDATVKFSSGKQTQFLALDKCLPGRDHLRILEIPSPENVEKTIEYDAEWLSILKATEPLINRNHSRWTLPDTLVSEAELAKNIGEMDNKFEEFGRVIEPPKEYRLGKYSSALLQTSQFRAKFLNCISTSEMPASTNAEQPKVLNPEEIELDI